MPLRRRLRVFAVAGVAAGVFWSFWAMVVYIVSPMSFARQAPFGPIRLIAFYFLAGQLGALVLSLLWPIARWAPGAVVAGTLAAFPLYAGAAMLMLASSEWVPMGLVAGLVGSLIIGGGLGYLAWADEHAR